MNNAFAFALISSSHSRARRALQVLLGVVAVVLVPLACVYVVYEDVTHEAPAEASR